MHDIKVMTENIGLPIRKQSKKYFVLPNYGSNQNHETYAYPIENETQCHCTPTPHHTILHPTIVIVQHLFQLCQQRSHLCFFLYLWFIGKNYLWQSKKDILPSFVNVEALLFFVQYGYASFQRTHLCSFYACDPLVRTACGNKKRCFTIIC
jgi:hypothetical protein